MEVQGAPGRLWMGRFEHGADLLESFQVLGRREHVRLALFHAIGAVQQAHVACYQQQKKQYHSIHLDQPLELIACHGNLSLKGEDIVAHAHVVFSDETGRAFGGHLLAGTPIFACEYTVQELSDATLRRGFDEVTGLPLWT